MYQFNVFMAILMALTIVSAGIFGDRFLGLPYRMRLIISLTAAAVFGGWIVMANVL